MHHYSGPLQFSYIRSFPSQLASNSHQSMGFNPSKYFIMRRFYYEETAKDGGLFWKIYKNLWLYVKCMKYSICNSKVYKTKKCNYVSTPISMQFKTTTEVSLLLGFQGSVESFWLCKSPTSWKRKGGWGGKKSLSIIWENRKSSH